MSDLRDLRKVLREHQSQQKKLGELREALTEAEKNLEVTKAELTAASEATRKASEATRKAEEQLDYVGKATSAARYTLGAVTAFKASDWGVEVLLPAIIDLFYNAPSLQHALCVSGVFSALFVANHYFVADADRRGMEAAVHADDHTQAMLRMQLETIGQSKAYANVCSGGLYGSGLNVSVAGLANTSVSIACDVPPPPPPTCPSPPPVSPDLPASAHACLEGPVARVFSTSDVDVDYMLGRDEALHAARVLAAHERLGGACTLRPDAAACFAHASGADGVLSRREYLESFVPCLLRGLPEACAGRLCRDAPVQ